MPGCAVSLRRRFSSTRAGTEWWFLNNREEPAMYIEPSEMGGPPPVACSPPAAAESKFLFLEFLPGRCPLQSSPKNLAPELPAITG